MSTENDPMAEIRASFFIECEELLEALQDHRPGPVGGRVLQDHPPDRTTRSGGGGGLSGGVLTTDFADGADWSMRINRCHT